MDFDVIVVGLGGHGSATLAQLAKSSVSVLGIEQFQPTHGEGSSHGLSRIYRQAYFEHPSYVPLLQRSLELWKELQDYYDTHEECKQSPGGHHGPLLNLCGGIMLGKPGSEVIEGTLKSIHEHNLPHQHLNSVEVKARYPAFQLQEDEVGIYEDNAGYLHPELCIESYVHMAKAHGALAHFGEKLVSYETLEGEGNVVLVKTDKGEYRCKKLILTVGAWAPEIYGGEIPIKLHIERRVLYWFKPNITEDQKEYYSKLPIYIWDQGQNGNFYGFPEQPGYEGTAKVAMHYSQKMEQSQDAAELMVCNKPEAVVREVKDWEIDAMRAMLKDTMPTLGGELKHTATCMYTMTPDQHFLIDFHPRNKNIIVASPCSGHGFKFCSVIGEILKDLALEGRTVFDISLFNLNSDNR